MYTVGLTVGDGVLCGGAVFLTGGGLTGAGLGLDTGGVTVDDVGRFVKGACLGAVGFIVADVDDGC